MDMLALTQRRLSGQRVSNIPIVKCACCLTLVLLMFKGATSQCLSALNLIHPPMLKKSEITFAAIAKNMQLVYVNGDGRFTVNIGPVDSIQRYTYTPYVLNYGEDFYARLFMLDKTLMALFYYDRLEKNIKKASFIKYENGGLTVGPLNVPRNFLSSSDFQFVFLGETAGDLFIFENDGCHSIFQNGAKDLPICRTAIMGESGPVDPKKLCKDLSYYCVIDTLLGEVNAYRRSPDRKARNIPFVNPLIHYKRAGNSFQQQALEPEEESIYTIPGDGFPEKSENKLVIHFRNTNDTEKSGLNSSICVYMPEGTYDAVIWDDKWDPNVTNYQDISFDPRSYRLPPTPSCTESLSIFETNAMFTVALTMAVIATISLVTTVLIGHAGTRRRAINLRKRFGNTITTAPTTTTKEDATNFNDKNMFALTRR